MSMVSTNRPTTAQNQEKPIPIVVKPEILFQEKKIETIKSGSSQIAKKSLITQRNQSKDVKTFQTRPKTSQLSPEVEFSKDLVAHT